MLTLIVKACVLATAACTDYTVAGFTTEKPMADANSATTLCGLHRDGLILSYGRIQAQDNRFAFNVECSDKETVATLKRFKIEARIVMEACKPDGSCVKGPVAEYYTRDMFNMCDDFVSKNAGAIRDASKAYGVSTSVRCNKEPAPKVGKRT